jgi:aspartyl/asparaginyl beta-hydroxylase (cupin superfamily)
MYIHRYVVPYTGVSLASEQKDSGSNLAEFLISRVHILIKVIKIALSLSVPCSSDIKENLTIPKHRTFSSNILKIRHSQFFVHFQGKFHGKYYTRNLESRAAT